MSVQPYEVYDLLRQPALLLRQIVRHVDASALQKHKPSVRIVHVRHGHLREVYWFITFGPVATYAAKKEVFPASLKGGFQAFRLHMFDFRRVLNRLFAITSKMPDPANQVVKRVPVMGILFFSRGRTFRDRPHQ